MKRQLQFRNIECKASLVRDTSISSLPGPNASLNPHYVYELGAGNCPGFQLIDAFKKIKPMKNEQNSLGFWIPSCGFWKSGAGFLILCQWNLDSGFQSSVRSEFLELYSGCWHVNEVNNIGSRNIFFNVSADWNPGHPTPGTCQGPNNDDLTPGRLWNVSLFPGPLIRGLSPDWEEQKDWSKGICYQRTKGYTGKRIPRQDWNLLILTGNKMLLANFQKLSFQFK